MDFAEIKVYSTDPNTNIANTAHINASSNLDPIKYPNSAWVDGSLDKMGHTSCNDAPWIELDFGNDIQFTKIIVYPKVKSRMKGCILTIKNNNGDIVYTSLPITSKSGDSTYVFWIENGPLDYNNITYNIPDKQ